MSLQHLQFTLKYRPRRFAHFKGQESAINLLQQSLATMKLAKSYIFCGQKGTGKTSMARVFASAINCQEYNETTNEPCGKCSSCKEIIAGTSMDYKEIDGATNRGIDEIRNIIEYARYKPTYNKKVVVIDEAHQITKIAWDAALKTVEEGNVIFIIVTTDPDKLPDTIVSRSRSVNFVAIDNKNISDMVLAVAKNEGIVVDLEIVSMFAEASDGSMRDTLMLFETYIIQGAGKLTKEVAQSVIASFRVDAALPKDLLLLVRRGDMKELNMMCRRIPTTVAATQDLVYKMLIMTKNLLIAKEQAADIVVFEHLFELNNKLQYSYGTGRMLVEFYLIKTMLELKKVK